MHGLYLLWWVQERQLPAPLVAAIIAAGDLALLGFEIPTGWFADRFGHRASLIAGSFVQVCGMLVCWLGDSVPELVIASVLVALGDAFRSGAGEALLYRSCVALGCESEFQRIHARAHAAGIIALVVLVLLGGALAARWGLSLGWAAETGLCAIGLAIACAMHEAPRGEAEATLPAGSQAWQSIATVPASLVLPAALIGAAASASAFIAQTDGQQEIAGVTLLVAVVALAEAAGSVAAVLAPNSATRVQLVLVAAGAVVIAGALLVPALFLPAVVALAFLAGLAEPLRDAAIQRTIADNVRATAASVASACDMAINLLVLPIAGGWRRRR